MPTKADTYRQMADHATAGLTAQVSDWSRFLLIAGQFYKYKALPHKDSAMSGNMM